MTPQTTYTSREAVELACKHVETHERNLNNGFPMTCEIGADIQSLIAICRAVVDERDALVAELDTLRDQLATARNEALEEAKRVAVIPCYETRHVTLGDAVANAIDAIKSNTPAQRHEATLWDVEEYKVWNGIDKTNRTWASRGFSCSTYWYAKDLMDYLAKNDNNLVLRVVARSIEHEEHNDG